MTTVVRSIALLLMGKNIKSKRSSELSHVVDTHDDSCGSAPSADLLHCNGVRLKRGVRKLSERW